MKTREKEEERTQVEPGGIGFKKKEKETEATKDSCENKEGNQVTNGLPDCILIRVVQETAESVTAR